MRLSRILTGTALALLLVTCNLLLVTCHAQTTIAPKPPQVLYTATVKDPEAEVRSGPSTDPKLYPTNRLRKGDVVEVVKEHDDTWLEIKPPKGSFSWINARFVEKHNDRTWVVNAQVDAPAEVLYGSRVTDPNVKPSVKSADVPRGTIL